MIDPAAPDYGDTPASHLRPSFGYAAAEPAAAPQVTILTPFYETGPVFHETARSVLRQSLQQWEWLIVNDGSTDPAALAVLEEYRDRDPRIRVLDLPTNGGPSAARNAGYRAARAPYVLQLDSDNLIEATAAEKWYWFLESHPEYAFVKGYSVGFGSEEYLWQRGFQDGRDFLRQNLVDATSLVRRSVHEVVGGYDEGIRGGLEDWDFWLRCASHGYWGGSVPEYLDWYRRRPNHAERWPDWDEAARQDGFRARLRERYPALWEDAFPRPAPPRPIANAAVPEALPCENRLQKSGRRLLMIVPWLTLGGADRFNLDLLDWLTAAGWEVSIATTLKGDHAWMPEFGRRTPDIFPLHHFLRTADFPRFLRYLIRSREVDAVMVSHSELAYLLLPYLRAHCPDVTFLDYCHIVEEYWKNGGYPRFSVEYQELLDLTIASSDDLRSWMVERGADGDRIEVCYTGVDVERLRPDPERRARVRQELGLAGDGPVVLFAGRIAEQKQPRVLAETFRLLRDRDVPFTALVAGDGPDLASLRADVTRHELDGTVRLLGAVPNERVRDLLAAADLFFLPSRWEGVALALYEAMACGVPVVSADVGGQRELVSPDCGVLVERAADVQLEAARYAGELERLLRSPEVRVAMGAAARARVSERFPATASAARMMALVDRASDLHRREPRPRPGPGVARTCAFQAVEVLRLTQLADELWAQRNRSDFRVRAYASLARTFEPLYHWGVNRGWTWLATARARLRLAVLGRS